EADPAAEADPAVPEHRGQRHVADRANEAEHRDDRSDQRAPELVEGRMVREEESLPEAVWHPGGERAGDQEPQAEVDVEAVDVHEEVVRDRRERTAGDESP